MLILPSGRSLSRPGASGCRRTGLYAPPECGFPSHLKERCLGRSGDAPSRSVSARNEARKLARKLNGGDSGILATPESPGCVLERETEAAPGTVPLWGQAGDFTVSIDAMRVRIEIKGIFGIGSTSCLFPGFYAHAVDMDRPFLSETGFRSFLGLSGDLAPGLTPEEFVRAVISGHVRRELKGRLKAIEPRYRE